MIRPGLFYIQNTVEHTGLFACGRAALFESRKYQLCKLLLRTPLHGTLLEFCEAYLCNLFMRLFITACGSRKNLRVAAATVLDFFRPLRFPRLASSSPGGNPQRSRVRVGEPLWQRKARQQSPLKTIHRIVFLTLLRVPYMKRDKSKRTPFASVLIYGAQHEEFELFFPCVLLHFADSP